MRCAFEPEPAACGLWVDIPVRELRSKLPPWVDALGQLRRSAGEHGLGGMASWGRIQRALASNFFEVTAAFSWPRKWLFAVQCNAAGSLMLADLSGNVVGPTSTGFVRIGSLEQVLRYGLRQLLDGQCWSQAYARSRDLDSYQLVKIDFVSE